MQSTYEVLQKLKNLRKQRKIKIESVVDYLQKNGIEVAVKTVYGWENGQASPSVQAFIALCSFYEIKDVLSLFFNENNVNDDKIEIYTLWNDYQSHKEMQEAIDKLLDR